jgi:prepilin peptidase CpaA
MITFAVVLSCLMFTVIVTDTTRYTIPNWLVGALLLLYPVMLAVAQAPKPDWKTGLVIGVVVFALGFIIFILKVMGGGDIKLMTVLGIWAGREGIFQFLTMVALLGGALALILWTTRKVLPHFVDKSQSRPLPRILVDDNMVPYGVAIAIAFLILLWTDKVPGIIV